MLLSIARVSALSMRRTAWYSTGEDPAVRMLKEIDGQVKSHPCTVYMKGDASSPRCGFSGMVVKVLNQEGADYKTYDVLSNDGLRTYVKDYSNWPTFPQVFISGEFVGGCDIVVDMHRNNELKPLLEKAGALKK